MMIAFIVVAAVAVLLGGVIAYLIINDKKQSKAAMDKTADKTEEVVPEFNEEVKPAEEPQEKPAEEIIEIEIQTEEPEPEPIPEPAEEVAAAIAPMPITDEEGEEETVFRPVIENGETRYIVIKYSKSFQAKIIQSEDITKDYYSQLKNKLLSYKGVKSRISWKRETFRYGRKTLAKMRMRGKTLSVCLALDPAVYEGTKYHVENLSEVKSYADVPCMYRIKNDRRLRYGKELIEELVRHNGVEELKTFTEENYVAQNPYDTTESLIERKLIKVLTDEDAQSGTEFKPRSVEPEPVQEVATPVILPVAEEEDEEEEAIFTPVIENGETRYIVIKYSKSFQAKIIQSEDITKDYYSQLKNKLLSYKGVKSRISWKWETFRYGRKTLAKMRMRGKTLSVCLALDPAVYEGTKYHIENLSEVKSYADVPCMYRIKNDRRLRYGKELIEELMRQNGIEELKTFSEENYVAQNPYDTTESLIERKLIKVLTDEDAQSGTEFKPRSSVTAQEVDSLMEDEVAVTMIQTPEETQNKPHVTDKSKQDIINIDTLSQYFKSGERVTLEEIKKRVNGFNKRTTYIKVLARGTLDKALIVEADNFSLQAVKMIVLTGGSAIKY